MTAMCQIMPKYKLLYLTGIDEIVMSKELKTLPMITREQEAKESCGAKGCGTGACAGGFGIKAGSEKNVVYRNILVYLLIGIVMLVTAYITLSVITSILN